MQLLMPKDRSCFPRSTSALPFCSVASVNTVKELLESQKLEADKQEITRAAAYFLLETFPTQH